MLILVKMKKLKKLVLLVFRLLLIKHRNKESEVFHKSKKAKNVNIGKMVLYIFLITIMIKKKIVIKDVLSEIIFLMKKNTVLNTLNDLKTKI